MLKKINYNESKKLYILVKNDTELVFFCHTLSVSQWKINDKLTVMF